MSGYFVRGQVLQVLGDRISIYLSGLMNDFQEDWIFVPPTMPRWARKASGPVFRAIVEIDGATKLTFEYIRQNPNCLQNFSCRPIPKNLDWLFD